MVGFSLDDDWDKVTEQVAETVDDSAADVWITEALFEVDSQPSVTQQQQRRQTTPRSSFVQQRTKKQTPKRRRHLSSGIIDVSKRIKVEYLSPLEASYPTTPPPQLFPGGAAYHQQPSLSPALKQLPATHSKPDCPANRKYLENSCGALGASQLRKSLHCNTPPVMLDHSVFHAGATKNIVDMYALNPFNKPKKTPTRRVVAPPSPFRL